MIILFCTQDNARLHETHIVLGMVGPQRSSLALLGNGSLIPLVVVFLLQICIDNQCRSGIWWHTLLYPLVLPIKPGFPVRKHFFGALFDGRVELLRPLLLLLLVVRLPLLFTLAKGTMRVELRTIKLHANGTVLHYSIDRSNVLLLR